MRLDHDERLFRFAELGIGCDEKGFRIGDVALLERGIGGSWRIRERGELSRDLSIAYGFPVDVGKRQAGFAAVATALGNGEVAKAQVAALLLRLPDLPSVVDVCSLVPERQRLADDLAAGGLLRTDADWDAKHPRTGTAPNPGWFAPGEADVSGGTGSHGGRSQAEPAVTILRTCEDAAQMCTSRYFKLGSPSLDNCVNAFYTCKESGAITIFGPGILGVR